MQLKPNVARVLMEFFQWRANAVREVLSQDKNELITQLYIDKGRDRMNLVRTKQSLEFWSMALHIPAWHHKLDELEDIASDIAKQEWGVNTLVEFNRRNGKVLVINPVKNRQTLIVDFAFREEMDANHQPEPPGAA